MSKFHSLTINKINQLTNDAVEISFNISNTDIFSFISGQYITVKHQINNEEVRRAYSICSSPSEGLSIGVKLVEGGKMSSFLTKEVKEGDALEIMPPSGNFVINDNKNNVVGICAGSGITPVLSMIKSILSDNPERKFTLIFGNQSQESTMFLETLRSIEQASNARLKIHWLFSREKVHSSINGRIDKNTLQQLLNTFSELKSADEYFICGPGKMIDTVSDFLAMKGIEKSKIYFERFTTTKKEETSKKQTKEITSNVLVSIDGDDFEFTLSSNGKSILDAAMDAGADVPFSCKGGVCCTCKAKVMEGKAIMDQNSSLSEDEVEEGFILTCQAHPITENIVVDFDEM